MKVLNGFEKAGKGASGKRESQPGAEGGTLLPERRERCNSLLHLIDIRGVGGLLK